MRLTVADLMTVRPVVVSPQCSADAAIDILSRHDAAELYVTDRAGRLLGVLPDYELLKAELSGDAHGATVEQLMSRGVPVFSPQTDAAEVARLFRDGRFRQFPVVQNGRLVGVITRADVVRLITVLRRIDSPLGNPKPEKIKRPRIISAPKSAGRTKSPVSTAATTPRRTRRVTPRIVKN